MKVVKIGGNVVDNPELLERFCTDFAALPGPKCLVHGGGVMASGIQKALGQEPVKIEGRRVTDEDTLRVVTMVYAGWCNKHITALLQARGCNAIGLSGCDGGVITAPKRAPKTLSDGVTQVDYGFVGDVTPACVDRKLVLSLCEMGLVPVFSAINHDGLGQLLNTNADTVACSVAAALGGELVYCFEKKGVLSDINDENSVIPLIDEAAFASLKAGGKVAEGMIPKLETAFSALRHGAVAAVIKHSDDLLKAGGTRLEL